MGKNEGFSGSPTGSLSKGQEAVGEVVGRLRCVNTKRVCFSGVTGSLQKWITGVPSSQAQRGRRNVVTHVHLFV